MSDLHLKKFPITSKNNEEYLVIIRSDRHAKGCVLVELYRNTHKKTIFGKDKVEVVNEQGLWSFPMYKEEAWNYDYKAMAINEVEEYEERVVESIAVENERKKGSDRFAEWDGNIT